MTGLFFVRGERWERRMFPLDTGRNDARSRRLIGISKCSLDPVMELSTKIIEEMKEGRHAQPSAA